MHSFTIRHINENNKGALSVVISLAMYEVSFTQKSLKPTSFLLVNMANLCDQLNLL